ncbi:peptidylprolyl isomerase [Malassezia cuniculi]|uniref:Peptidyl-prolyl cis-trans isomerase n=1 Tax=Malassezia cuniculi TaxID=948313 RepID=A0AAF0J590_9BASI|nr:peptidylprolyl isomerase [Malassezia cuniculi]
MASQWEVRFSNSRKLPYFYDSVTSTSIWELPPGITEEQARQLPGGHLLGHAAAPSGSAAPEKVRASHLLIKHRDSRRPSSWREPNITRTKEEAIATLKEHQRALGEHPSIDHFASLAHQFSDCSSARSGGDLGSFGRGQMQRPFEEAAFALPVGQLSGIVDTDSGVHLILRTA